jgi:hypothetical protein
MLWNRSSGNAPLGNAPRNAGRVTLRLGPADAGRQRLALPRGRGQMRNARTKRLRRGTSS